MNVYVVYDSHYNDSDLISVPDRLSYDMQKLAQMFCDWLSKPDLPNSYYVYVNGQKCVNCETQGFVDWLNAYFVRKDEHVSIIKQHIKYAAKSLKVDF